MPVHDWTRVDSTDYIPVPLEATYQAAWEGMPAFRRNVLAEPATS
jgi:hypothetical protein